MAGLGSEISPTLLKVSFLGVCPTNRTLKVGITFLGSKGYGLRVRISELKS